MQLEGIHHITAITADARRNVDFYAGLLGLRLVKKTVNQDQPTVYHLFYADERGSAGADMTFFEFPDAAVGRPGAGMVHRVVWRVGSAGALDFWERRLGDGGYASSREAEGLRFSDYEGLDHELVVADGRDLPLTAAHPEIPPEHAIQGFEAVRAYVADPGPSRGALEETLGFAPAGEGRWEARGRSRGGYYHYDEPPVERGMQAAGTVHHVAWAAAGEEHETWRRRVAESGLRPTPIIDRYYFRSIYFREPSGVLFEIATLGGPGFAADEDPEHLGERLSLPPFLESRREQLEPLLTPIENPRQPART